MQRFDFFVEDGFCDADRTVSDGTVSIRLLIKYLVNEKSKLLYSTTFYIVKGLCIRQHNH